MTDKFEFADGEDIKHVRSPQFISDLASGVVVSGPLSENLFQLLFYAEATDLEFETIKRNEDGTSRVIIKEEAISRIREDKARILLTPSALRSLQGLLSQIVEELDRKNTAE